MTERNYLMSKLGRLQSVELRKIWPDEAQNFTPWLAEEENLVLLGETLGMELEFEGQELDVGDFRADILCRNTEDDSRVLIENQLEQTNHKHLGQILTYSAGLDIHTVIWIAKRFREEHRAALDRLNEITDERFQYFGIEVKVWQIEDSAHAPQFEIVSKPNDWNRTVSRDTERAVINDLSETQLLQEKFWTEFGKYLISKYPNEEDMPIRKPKPQPVSRMVFGLGKAEFKLYAILAKRDRQIRIQLTLLENNAKAHFHLLRKDQEKIENEVGESLEWLELPGREESQVCLLKNDTDLTNEIDWTNQHKWLAAKLEKFDEVFRPRVHMLNAADWEPPEDEDDE